MSDHGEVLACPNCDGTSVKTNSQTGFGGKDAESAYSCSECGARFDEPVRRKARSHRNGRHGLAGELSAADPDDVGRPMTDGGLEFDQGERIADALERIADELQYQNAVLSEQARAQHLTAVSSNDYTEPNERAEVAPKTRSLLTMIQDHESERERVDDERLMPDGGEATQTHWTLECLDCDWDETLITEDDQGNEPPSEVDERVRDHKEEHPKHVVRATPRAYEPPEDVDSELMTDGGAREETIQNWLVINWREGTTRTRKSKPDPSSLGTHELATSLTLNVTIPDVDVPELVADVEVPQPRVEASELSNLDVEDAPDWRDVADDVVDDNPEADPFDEVDRLVVAVLEDAPGRPDVDEVKRYLQSQLRGVQRGEHQ